MRYRREDLADVLAQTVMVARKFKPDLTIHVDDLSTFKDRRRAPWSSIWLRLDHDGHRRCSGLGALLVAVSLFIAPSRHWHPRAARSH